MTRAPTMAELVVLMRDLPDGPERRRVEGWYWAKAIDRFGVRRARWHREEYEWLRANRRGSKVAQETAA